MRLRSDRLLYALLTNVWVVAMVACSSLPEQRERTVAEVMDKTITSIYATMDEEEINELDYQQVLSLLNEDDLDVLSRRHWVFDVNVPAKLYLMRSQSQKRVPFWIEPAGFHKTGLTMKNEYHTYEVWEKVIEPGTVELGINGFENFSYHYFVAVAPLDPEDSLHLSVSVPQNDFVGVLDDGAFTYHDWTELVIANVPEEMKGSKLLTTVRGRGKESHLIGAFRKTDFPSSDVPDQVMLTWSSDPSTSVDIQWRTNTTVETGEVKYRMSGSSVVQSAKAEKYRLEDRELMNDRFIYRFTAKLRDLKPGTGYEYLIAPESDWTKACSFSTSGNDETFSFIWFGDVHNKPEFGKLHKKAEENHPDVAFYSIAGDLVGDGLYRDQWDELFEYSKDVICKKALMNVPGNHDNRLGLGAKTYRDMFSYPVNGPKDVPEEQTYSFTYKNALFLMIDATSGVGTQTGWIEDKLAHTDAIWKFAVFHFPPYNWKEPYLNIQEEWVPVFDKYHVDMVFSGHFHYYMRSAPMKGGQVANSYNDGTVYVISLGIPGREGEMSEEPYAAVRDQAGWLYQYITIDENRLYYKSVNMAGKTIDEFNIEK